MAKAHKMDFTEGPILKKLIIFTLPIIASSLLQQFYTTADQIVVGKFAGDTALAAVGSTGYVTNLILNLFMGLSVGATVTCAKYLGAKNKEGVKRAVHTAYAIAVVAGIMLTFIGVLLSRPLLQMMDTPDDVIDHSVVYMTIIFLGTPFSMLYNFGAGLLRAAGDTKRPLYILAVSGFVNVLLNLLFVIVFNMAEAGVALATITSQMISSMTVMYLMAKRDDDLKLTVREIRFYKEEFFNTLRIGIPAGLNAILYNISNITLQSAVNSFGKEYMAASTAGSSITNYINLVQGGFGTATVSFVGQNYGAKKFKRIDKLIIVATVTAVSLSTILACLITLSPSFFLSMFTDSPTVIEKGTAKTLIMTWGYILHAPSAIFGSTLRGMEKSKTPMYLNILAICVSRIGWVSFVFPLYPKFEMLFYCYPISWGLCSISLGIAYLVFRKKALASANAIKCSE